MGLLDFIFGVLALVVVAFLVVGVTVMKYDTKKLEQENTFLKEELSKARMRKVKREYKKAKEVKE